MEEKLTTKKVQDTDKRLEITLRPQQLSDFIGQTRLKRNLDILLQAAKKRSEPIEHLLFHGPPGLGKTTLAHIISREMGAGVRVTSGPAIERAGDLAAILTNLEDGDVLFIDEIHRLNKTIEEILYPAMEDFALDLVVGKGPSARTLRLDIPKFTLIGATTKLSMISSPLRDRFGSVIRLEFYTPDELSNIIIRSANILGISIPEDVALEIASRSRATPRIANRLLKRARDYAQVKGDGNLTPNLCQASLDLMEVDKLGLDSIDRRILQLIIKQFNGGPVGLSTLAASSGEETATIEDVYEPYLMQIGFLARTPRGRTATGSAYKHLGHTIPNDL